MNDLGTDLELRLVRYFTVVAAHLNFGRAAAELHLAQPSLSRQIQRLEDRLGVRLLDRTPQGSRLTEAGEAFLPQAQALLQAARQAALTARAYAPAGVLTIGFVEDLIVTPAVRELRRRFPEAEIATRHLDWHDERALPEGRVDALVARTPLPFPAREVRVTVLYEEPRVLVVPATHRLAGRGSVTLDDFAGEKPIPCDSGGTAWSSRARSGPVIESFEDKLEQIATGEAIAMLPMGARRTALRPDLATIPVEGVPAAKVVVATRAGDPNPLAGGFHEAAHARLHG